MILSLTIDNQLSFDNQPCKEKLQKSKKASQKTCALSRTLNYLDLKQREIIFKEMIGSQT